MDVFEAMANRRSVRKYLPDPVGEEDLTRILEAGRMAASWANTQCWEIVLVRDPAVKEKLAATVPAYNPGRGAIMAAPLVLAACARTGRSGFEKGLVTTVHGDWMLFDVALFLANVTHAAHALGYGTLHVGLFDHAAAAAVLGAPDDIRLVELMPIGRSARPPRPGPPRRQLAEFLHQERF
ncbi:MAG: nitroreductase family protein [Deltaproteobacteria bacterium]|nr:nitroreductase family protein [Deltaproteobacteria bacterium]